MRAGLDIFFAFLGDKAGRPHREREQEQREDDDVDQARIEKLRGVAFDQPDDQPGDNGSFDIAKAADNHDGEGLDDDESCRQKASAPAPGRALPRSSPQAPTR